MNQPNQSTDCQPMTPEDIKEAFEKIGRYLDRLRILLQASTDLGDPATLSCNLCFEGSELLEVLYKVVNDYEERIIQKGIAQRDQDTTS